MQEAFTHRSEAFKRFLETSRQLKALQKARKNISIGRSGSNRQSQWTVQYFLSLYSFLISWFLEARAFLKLVWGGSREPREEPEERPGSPEKSQKECQESPGNTKTAKGFESISCVPPPVLLATSEASLGKFQGAYGRAGREAMETKGHWNSWGGIPYGPFTSSWSSWPPFACSFGASLGSGKALLHNK